MAESDESKASPPYGSFGTFWNYVSGLKAETLPPQLDRSMMRGKSGSDQAVINMALKFFDLVDPDNHNAVRPRLRELVAADEAGRKTMLQTFVRMHYPEQVKVSDNLGTEKLLHESFGTAFDISASETRRKAATFFLHAATTAGIPVSPNFPKARPGQGRGPANGTAAKKTTAKKKAAAPKITPEAQGSGETVIVTIGEAGTVTMTVNVRWLELDDDKFTSLRKVVADLKALDQPVVAEVDEPEEIDDADEEDLL